MQSRLSVVYDYFVVEYKYVVDSLIKRIEIGFNVTKAKTK